MAKRATAKLSVIPDIARGPTSAPLCSECPLAVDGKAKKPVPGEGPREPPWIVVGEGPGRNEVLQGRPFVGASGRLFMRVLDSLKVEREDIWITNATLCLPPNSKTQKMMEDARRCCQPRLIEELDQFPGVPILALGAHGAQTLVGDKFKISEMASALQKTDIFEDKQRNVIATHHPARILRGGDGKTTHDRAVDLLFLDLIYDAGKIAAIGRGDDIEFSDDVDIAIRDPAFALELYEDVFADIQQTKHCAIDVETDGRDTGSARVCNLTAIAIATVNFGVSADYSSLSGQTEAGRAAWAILREICADPSITVVFHNRQYDELVLGRYDVHCYGPVEDTMLKHHAAFPGSSHKLQDVGTQFFAIPPWKAEFRKGAGTPEELGFYNARDTLVTARLDPLLDRLIEHTDSRRAYEIDNALAPVAMQMEIVGMPIDFRVNRKLHEGFQKIIRENRGQIEEQANDPETFEKFLDKLAMTRALVRRKNDPPDILDRHTVRYQELKFGIRMKRDPTKFLKGKGPVVFTISNPDHIAAYLMARGHRLYRTTATGKISTKKDYLEELTHIEDVRVILMVREALYLDSHFAGGLPLEGTTRWMRLHSTWDIHKITGRWGSKPNCFDGETEILTEEGWIRFDALPRDVKVAQFEPSTEQISFVQPTDYIAQDWEGNLVEIQGNNVDFVGTPEHRMLVRTSTKRWEDRPAEKMCDREGKLWHAGFYQDGTERLSKDYITLLCACWAKGTWDGTTWQLLLPTRIQTEHLQRTLDQLGISSATEILPRENTGHPIPARVDLEASAIGKEIKEWLGASVSFGPWVLQLDFFTMRLLLEEATYWSPNPDRRNWLGAEKRDVDWLQITGVLTGQQTKVRPPYYGYWNEFPPRPWSVQRMKNTFKVTSFRRNQVWRKQKVYCVTVPSSYIVVRRNGRAYVTGNCQNWPKANMRGRPNLRSQVIAPPRRKLVGADYAQLEARIIGLLSGDPFLLQIFMENFGKCAAGCTATAEPVKFCPLHDLHTVFAVEVFSGFMDMTKSEKKELRDLVKRGEYGGFYGGSIETLYASIVKEFNDVSLKDVAKIVQIIATRMPKVASWHQKLMRQAMKGEIRSALIGRRRTFPLGHAEMTVVYNFPVQATGADIISEGIRKLHPQLPSDAEIIIHGHDALIVECDEENAEDVAELMTESLSATYEVDGVKMFFPANAVVGDCWTEV